MTQVVERPPDREYEARIGPEKIRKLYDQGVKATQAETRRYNENLAFLQGEQWIYFSKAANRLEEMPRDESRVRATVNRLGSSCRRLLAKSLKRPLLFEVPPSAADDATIQGARIAESVLSDVKRDQNWENLREQTTIAALIGGTGLICLDWDPSAGTPLEMDEDRMVGTGEVSLTALAITEWVTEPGTRDAEYARWGIKAQALPSEEVKQTYRLPEKPAADATTALSPVQQKILQTDRAYKPEDLCLVLTYYERPCPEYPEGQVCVVVGSQMVDGPHPWPFPFQDRMNIAVARETKVLHRWTGDTIVSHAVPIQTLYNQIWSSIAEHTKLAGNLRILWPMGAGDAVDSLSDLPAEIIEYMVVNGAKPEWMEPGQLPAWLIQQPEMLASEMDDLLGLPDVVRGEAPRNIESGSGLAILSEAAETPIAKLSVEVANAYARIASMALECYAEKVQESREARVDYPHQVSQTVEWSGEDLKGQTNVIVPESAVLPTSAAEVWTKGTNLFDRGAFGPPGEPQTMRKFAAYISSSGDEENFIEATDPDVAKAQRENYQLSLGAPCVPMDFDDHARHIEVHNTWRKSAAYEQLKESPDFDMATGMGDPGPKELIDLHVIGHQILASEAAARATNMAIHDAGTGHLAAAPTADGGATPPGDFQQAPLAGGQPGSVEDQMAEGTEEAPPPKMP